MPKKRKRTKVRRARKYGPFISKALLAQRRAAAAEEIGPMFGPFIPDELLARRRADATIAAAFRKLKKRPAKKRRGGKKKVSAAQRAARARFAAAAKARSKAGKRSKTRKPAACKKTRATKRKGAQRTVTAAQIVSMAKKGSLKRWLCGGPKRTGCGSTGRVISGKGNFRRTR